MLDANPRVARGGFREYWLGSCYTDRMLIGIRRETGAGTDSIGIRRSLNGLAANPRMASRDWYEQQIRQRGHQDRDAWELAGLDAGFNIFSAPGQPFINAGRVKQDITALEAVIGRVNNYTTKAIAHRNDNLRGAPAAPAVTWAELDTALDAVGNIYNKYYRLRHPGETLGALTPLVSSGLDSDVPDGMDAAWLHLPDDLDFEPAAGA